MTNILEKSLLIGFGIFILILFFSFITPFLNYLIDFRATENSDINSIISFIDDIDNGIHHVIQYPDINFIKTIEYPKKLNISFEDKIAKFYFIFEDNYQQKIFEYSKYFVSKYFENMPPRFYVLNISMKFSNILVNLI